jgi:hypothetical protein
LEKIFTTVTWLELKTSLEKFPNINNNTPNVSKVRDILMVLSAKNANCLNIGISIQMIARTVKKVCTSINPQ